MWVPKQELKWEFSKSPFEGEKILGLVGISESLLCCGGSIYKMIFIVKGNGWQYIM